MNATSLQHMLQVLSGFTLDAPVQADGHLEIKLPDAPPVNLSAFTNRSLEETEGFHHSVDFSPLLLVTMMMSCIMAVLVCVLCTLFRLGAFRRRQRLPVQSEAGTGSASVSTAVSIGSRSQVSVESASGMSGISNDHTYAASPEVGLAEESLDAVVQPGSGVGSGEVEPPLGPASSDTGHTLERLDAQVEEVHPDPSVDEGGNLLSQLDDYASAFLYSIDAEYEIFFDPDLLAVRGRRIWRSQDPSRRIGGRGQRHGRGGRRIRRRR